MNRKFILFEKIFAIVSFIHYSGGPLLLFLSGGVSEGEDGDDVATFALINVIFLVIYAITFVLLSIRWKKRSQSFPKVALCGYYLE
jgi:exopolysaccharide production protein ExoQ